MANLKNDLPDLYMGEYVRFDELKRLGVSRTTTGTISFTSSSSNTTYNSTTGQLGIMQQLETVLNLYKINASDWNGVDNAITQHLADDATTSVKGHVQLATNAEVTTGTNTTKAVTPAGVKAVTDAHALDYVRQPGYGTTAGTGAAYTLTLSPALASYVAGVCVAIKIHTANTGACTLNVNSLGAKNLLKPGGTAMAAGDLKLNGIYTFRYDGTSFILQGEGGGSNIKSIQRGSITSVSTSTTVDITISSVDVNKSTVEIRSNPEGTAANTLFYAELINSTTVRLTRYGTSSVSSNFKLDWEVTEYNNVKSKQSGLYTTTLTRIDESVSISTIDPNKSKLILSQAVNYAGTAVPYVVGAGIIASATSFVLYGAAGRDVAWQVIEFN